MSSLVRPLLLEEIGSDDFAPPLEKLCPIAEEDPNMSKSASDEACKVKVDEEDDDDDVAVGG